MAAGDEPPAAAAAAAADEDYMGDLSLFLPTTTTSSSSSSFSKKKPQPPPQASKTKPSKTLSWQQRRQLDRDRKQREEDERTAAAMLASIPPSNVGFKLLRRMGYDPGSALGKDGAGRADPVGIEIRRSRAGLGAESPVAAAARKEREAAERKRRREEEMTVEFGSRQKAQWRSRRVFGDYQKAEAALAQLENREVVEPEKDEESEEEEEEEEEVITDEDLHSILMKLRDEYHYCLYCGCQYESMEALVSDCPGLNEEDH